MISCEAYKMFKGTMKITPICTGEFKMEPFDVKGSWLYRPEHKCWYCNGSSYPEKICSIVNDETV